MPLNTRALLVDHDPTARRSLYDFLIGKGIGVDDFFEGFEGSQRGVPHFPGGRRAPGNRDLTGLIEAAPAYKAVILSDRTCHGYIQDHPTRGPGSGSCTNVVQSLIHGGYEGGFVIIGELDDAGWVVSHYLSESSVEAERNAAERVRKVKLHSEKAEEVIDTSTPEGKQTRNEMVYEAVRPLLITIPTLITPSSRGEERTATYISPGNPANGTLFGAPGIRKP